MPSQYRAIAATIKRGDDAEDEAADGPLDGLLRAEPGPELVPAGKPAERIGPVSAPLAVATRKTSARRPWRCPSNHRIWMVKLPSRPT